MKIQKTLNGRTMILCLLMALLPGLLSVSVAAGNPPGTDRPALAQKGRIVYSLVRGESGAEFLAIGRTTHTWAHDGKRYNSHSLTETTGLAAMVKKLKVVQTSTGELVAGGLRPVDFRHERVNGLDTAHLDWSRRVVAYEGKEEPIGVGTQDMLSMYYQLVLQAPKSGSIELPIATGRKLEKFAFRVVGEETLKIAGQERRVLRLATRSGVDSIEVWLALHASGARAGQIDRGQGLPLKIRVVDKKGDVYDQVAEELDVQAAS